MDRHRRAARPRAQCSPAGGCCDDSHGKGWRCTNCHRGTRVGFRIPERGYAYWSALCVRPGRTGRFPIFVCRRASKVSNSPFLDTFLRDSHLAACIDRQLLVERHPFCCGETLLPRTGVCRLARLAKKAAGSSSVPASRRPCLCRRGCSNLHGVICRRRYEAVPHSCSNFLNRVPELVARTASYAHPVVDTLARKRGYTFSELGPRRAQLM